MAVVQQRCCLCDALGISVAIAKIREMNFPARMEDHESRGFWNANCFSARLTVAGRPDCTLPRTTSAHRSSLPLIIDVIIFTICIQTAVMSCIVRSNGPPPRFDH